MEYRLTQRKLGPRSLPDSCRIVKKPSRIEYPQYILLLITLPLSSRMVPVKKVASLPAFGVGPDELLGMSKQMR